MRSLVDAAMKKDKPLEKRFIIRKYIMATSASQALRKGRNYKADECWIDEKWIEQATRDNAPAIGFSTESERDSW